MNRSVLAEVGMAPERMEPVMLPGFDIRISPRANLVKSRDHVVFGVLASATHAELERLYAHARTVLGEIYLPEAVLVNRLDGGFEPAMCYLAPAMADSPAETGYVERMLKPARELCFPSWYIARIESFIPR